MKQTTWCWCPACGHDLVSNPGVHCTDDPDGTVRYQCTCGHVTVWDFDLPVPVLLSGGRDVPAPHCPGPHGPISRPWWQGFANLWRWGSWT